MGVHSYDIEDRHKQHTGNRLDFPFTANVISLDIFKRVRKMSEIKFIAWFANAFGYSFTGVLGLNWVIPFLKIEDFEFGGWKSDVIFALIVLFWIQKGVFAVIKNIQDSKNRSLSLKKKSHDIEREFEHEPQD
jgi:hypothetical protein